MAYTNNAYNVDETPVQIAVRPNNSGLLVMNQGSDTIYFGGLNVTAKYGYPLPAGNQDTIPTIGGGSGDSTLYAVMESGKKAVLVTLQA